MHWWVLPCVACTGGVFPSMFCGYTDPDCNLDCVVDGLLAAGGGGGNF